MKFLLLGNFVVPIKKLFFIVFKLHQIINDKSNSHYFSSNNPDPSFLELTKQICIATCFIFDFNIIKSQLYTHQCPAIKMELIFITIWHQELVQNINKIKFTMSYSSKFNSKTLMREFITKAQIQNPKQRTSLKQKFQKKLSHHINMIQYHRLREDRFILSQKKIIEKQNHSIERAKEFINLKQEKASTLKNYKLIQRSKRAQEDLSRWESIVQKNKDNYKKQIHRSQIVIKNWNNKLSESCERKSIILDDVSKNLKQKSQQKHKKIQNLRTYLDKLNPQGKQIKQGKKKKRQHESQCVKERVATETNIEKRRKQEQEQMNSSIIKIVNKEERINQARYTRHFLHEKKKKQLIQKGKMMQAIRDYHLTSLRNNEEERHQEYDKRYKMERVKSNHLISKSKEKISIPKQELSNRNSNEKKVILKDASSLRIFNSFGQENNHKSIQYSHNVSPNRNYQKLMTEKLKDISMIMRLNRNIKKIQ